MSENKKQIDKINVRLQDLYNRYEDTLSRGHFSLAEAKKSIIDTYEAKLCILKNESKLEEKEDPLERELKTLAFNEDLYEF